jgi:hypothetical protein
MPNGNHCRQRLRHQLVGAGVCAEDEEGGGSGVATDDPLLANTYSVACDYTSRTRAYQ